MTFIAVTEFSSYSQSVTDAFNKTGADKVLSNKEHILIKPVLLILAVGLKFTV